MKRRVYNFSAGPSTLPVEALKRLKKPSKKQNFSVKSMWPIPVSRPTSTGFQIRMNTRSIRIQNTSTSFPTIPSTAPNIINSPRWIRCWFAICPPISCPEGWMSTSSGSFLPELRKTGHIYERIQKKQPSLTGKFCFLKSSSLKGLRR